jgi:hypothetical protein
MLQSQEQETLGSKEQQRIRQLITVFNQAIDQISAIDALKIIPDIIEQVNFFKAPTHTAVTNSSDQTLSVYYHPAFGKHWMNQSRSLDHSKNSMQTPESTLPPLGKVVEFIKAFD